MDRKDKRSAKLSSEDVAKIKKLREEGYTLTYIGDLYKVHYLTIRLVVSKKARLAQQKLTARNLKRNLKSKTYREKYNKIDNASRIRRRWENPALREYLSKKASIYYKSKKIR